MQQCPRPHLEYHWLLSASLLILLAREVPVKKLDVRDKFTTLYTCCWYVRERCGSILYRARIAQTLLPVCMIRCTLTFQGILWHSYWGKFLISCSQQASIIWHFWRRLRCYPQLTVDVDTSFSSFMARRLSDVRLAWLWLLHRPPRDRYGF